MANNDEVEPIVIDKERYYEYDDFSDLVDRSYDYIKQCANNIGEGPDLTEYVRYVGRTPLINESAQEVFDN